MLERNNAIVVELFRPADYVYVHSQPGSAFSSWSTDPPDGAAHILALRGELRTLWLHGDIVAIIGYLPLRAGVCEVTFIPAGEWRRHKLAICRIIRDYLKVPLMVYHRIQMTCLADDEHLRFAEFFGFKNEGLLRQYDRLKRDYFMLSIIREDKNG